jgi:hypothetical protein
VSGYIADAADSLEAVREATGRSSPTPPPSSAPTAPRPRPPRKSLSSEPTSAASATSTGPPQTPASPHPDLLQQAITASNADPDACTLVGDELSDIDAARLAGTRSIGYANEPGKADAFTDAGAGAIVTSLSPIALALRARPLLPN